jgi:hypothetical protein
VLNGSRAALPWQRTGAIREAWRLYERDTREPSIELFPGLDPGHDALPEQTAARDAVRALVELPPKQRDTLALLILGFSYDEIAAHRDVTKTNVNRHLTVPVAPTTRTGPQQRCVDRRGGTWTSVPSGVVRTAPESPAIASEPVTYLGIKALVPETERTSGRFRAIP